MCRDPRSVEAVGEAPTLCEGDNRISVRLSTYRDHGPSGSPEIADGRCGSRSRLATVDGCTGSDRSPATCLMTSRPDSAVVSRRPPCPTRAASRLSSGDSHDGGSRWRPRSNACRIRAEGRMRCAVWRDDRSHPPARSILLEASRTSRSAEQQESEPPPAKPGGWSGDWAILPR